MSHGHLDVWTDGACRGNGYGGSVAGWGVYFGKDSPYNSKGRLYVKDPTNSQAEIAALQQAVLIVQHEYLPYNRATEVCFKMDSKYLVDAFTRWFPGWIKSDGRKADGNPVAHFGELLKVWVGIDEIVRNHKVKVAFEHVRREFNQGADRLAKQALDS